MSLTVLHSTSGKHAAKRFTRNTETGEIKNRSYDEEKYFRIEVIEVDSFAELCAALERLCDEPHAFAVRGVPRPGINRNRCRRLLHKDTRSGDDPTLAAAAQRYLLVDVDHVACPATIDPVSDPDGAIEYLIGLLPPELHDACTWWQYSSSQGLPGTSDTISAHLWFWADEPYSDDELTRWALAHNRRVDCKVIDPSLFRAVQPHYVAAPSFVGLTDPLVRRCGVRRGLEEAVALVIPPPDARRPEEPGTGGYAPGLGVAAYLAEMGGPAGFRGPILKAIASYVSINGSKADCGPLKKAIREALDHAYPGWRRDPQRMRYVDDNQLDQIIEWVRQHHGDRPPRSTDIIDQLNAQYAVVNEAGKVWVFEERKDPQLRRNAIIRFSFADFQRLLMNRMITTPDGDAMTLAKYWLGHKKRRQYIAGVTFDPTSTAPPDFWNLWRGFAIEPKQGDWHLMHEHIGGVLCRGVEEHREYLINTMARMVQQPQLPAEVAVVLRGKKGSGKGTLCVALWRLWGQHGIHVTNAKHLVGQFNSHLRDCIYMFADEAFFAGDRQHEGVLKGLVTEPSIAIEGKFQNVVMTTNMLHIWMAANAEWVVPASHDERRYFMLDVSDAMLGNKAYFTALHEEIERGGIAAMLHDLLKRDISKFEHRIIPQTAALAEQKMLSLDTLDRWWLDVLERGYLWHSRWGMTEFMQWRPFVSTDLLWASYLQWCNDTRVRYVESREMLGKRMSEMHHASRPRGDHIIGEAPAQPVIIRKGGRVWGYQLGKLETAKAAFAAKRGVKAGRGGPGSARPKARTPDRDPF